MSNFIDEFMPENTELTRVVRLAGKYEYGMDVALMTIHIMIEEGVITPEQAEKYKEQAKDFI